MADMQARRVVRSVLFVVFSLIVLGLPGCDDSPPPLPPNSPGGGFFIETLFQPSPGVLQIAPNVTTIWEWLQDLGSAGGNASTFTNTTNGVGIGVAFNARTPAAWEVHWTRGGPPQCINASNFPGVRFDSFQDQVTNVICAQPVQFSLQSGATTSFSPNPLYT